MYNDIYIQKSKTWYNQKKKATKNKLPKAVAFLR